MLPEGFIKTGPDHDDIAIGQGGDGRADLKIIRGGVDHHVTRQPRIAGREKPGVNVLKSLLPTLPHKSRAAAFQQRHPRIFLIARALHVDAEGTAGAGEGAIELHRTHPPAVAVSNVVLPDGKTATGRQCHIGMNLIAGQGANDGIFSSIGGVIIGLAPNDGWKRKHPPPAKANHALAAEKA